MTEANKTLQQAIKHTFDQSLGIENEIEKTTFITVQRKKQKKTYTHSLGIQQILIFMECFYLGIRMGSVIFFLCSVSVTVRHFRNK